ncbi:hypothetical protein MNEG_12315 [Monoraphidium neglectum]|uniref:Protein kinase domain-containing protein n=1 Tax=Monoraphidium neglectum TaxID=145388 RepID=A0A0D2MLF7_9CHLO|nr:hypothetical protein MNEG_12315 [Monoraphidium neglectum]KIY95645.1 hypothetical protein MNEG_12315 [Monoraphidium neglectum]|eukprot:XP_013894665.1 hypothetical protein MNEG_12315 [Monoraphidium neglectum]
MAEMVLSSHKSGWRVIAHHSRAVAAAAAAARGSAGSRGSAGAASVRDKIELGVLLGAGSFGRVYKGRWQGRDVAVKVMQHDAAMAAQFANEAALMMSFEHPNILEAFDFITWAHGPGPGSIQERGSRESAPSAKTVGAGALGCQGSAKGGRLRL